MFRRLAFIVGLLLLGLELAGAAVLAREGLRLSRIASAIPAEERAGLDGLTGQSLSNLDAASLQTALGHFTVAGHDAQQVLEVVPSLQPLLAPALRSGAAALEQRQGLAALTAVVDGGDLAGTLQAAAPGIIAATSSAGSDHQALLHLLTQQQSLLASALARTANLDRELSVVRAGGLDRALAPALTEEQRDLPLAEEALRFAIVAPAVLGAEGPVSYLVVAQDPADLRPSGGFMGSWGVLTLDKGQVTGLKYQGYVPWEDIHDPKRDWPVQTAPMQRYLGFCCLAMQDANWYPDFPTTARALELLNEGDQPAPLSGVIAFDPALVQVLLRLTGPVELPDQHVTVTDANLVDLANLYEGRGPTPPPAGQALGKEFLTLVAQALVTRLSQNPHLSLPTLGAALLPLLNDKHLLLTFDAPDPASVVADFGWDGALTTPPGDYLLLDGTSMSDNKIDGSIARSVTDSVRLAADGSAEVTVNVSLRNTFPYPVDRGATTTDFRDFLRLYLPAGATAIGLTGVDDVWPVSTESGHVVASGYLVVRRGQTRVVTLTYHAPAAVVAGLGGDGYALHVQVQPGIQPLQFHLHVAASDGSRLTDTAATLQHDQAWFFATGGPAGRPAPTPAWDRTCAAYALVAGFKGPFDATRLTVPDTCLAGAKPS